MANASQFSFLVEEPATLFLYFKGDEPSFGFVVETEQTAILSSFLNNWQETMPADFAKLFNALAGQTITFEQDFQQAQASGYTFDYLDSDKAGFGLCFSLIGDRFVLTSSGESIIKVIDRLKQ